MNDIDLFMSMRFNVLLQSINCSIRIYLDTDICVR